MQKCVNKQKQLVLCHLHELFVAFKERNPDVKIGFSKFCTLHPKWCVIAGSSGTYSTCVCTTHQNIILLVETLNWEVTYKDLVNKVVCDPSNPEYMMHRCTNCPGTNALCKFLEEELSDIDPDFQFHYSQWQTADRASLVMVTSTCEEYKDTLILAINAITKHLFLAKFQANFLRAKKECLKANEVIVPGIFAENYQFLVQDEIQSYHWSKEYCTLHPLVLYFIDGDGNFVYKIQIILVDYLKENLSIVDKIFCFSVGCAEQCKNHKNFINLCHHQQDFSMDAEWIFFATSHGKSPCDGVGGFLNVMLQNVVYKDPYMTKF